MMRTGLAVDCGCELPAQYIADNNLTVLPALVRFQDHDFVDDRDEQKTLAAYQHGLDSLLATDTAGTTTAVIEKTFLNTLVTKYDFVFVLTTSRQRAKCYEHCMKASARILNDYRPLRDKAGVAGPFALRVLDSNSLGSGYGVLATAAVERIKTGATSQVIRSYIDELTPHIHSFFVIRDLGVVRKRMLEKNYKPIGWLQSKLVGALDLKPVLMHYDGKDRPISAPRHFEAAAKRCFAYLRQRIQEGLLVPTISIAYGGDLKELVALPGFADLQEVAQRHKVSLLTSMQCVSTAAYCSPGSLNFGFCAKAHKVRV